MLSDFCFQSCRNISCSEPSFAFTVPKPLRFGDYVTLPRSQGITKTDRISQDGFSGSRVDVIKPNVTQSVQKPQAMQTTTISRQQHPLPPRPLHCPRPIQELVTAGAPTNMTETF